MNLVIDIDDTLIFSDKIFCEQCGRIKYETRKIDEEEISILNNAYDKGHIILLWTGRNWDCYDMTVNQLKDCGIKYHELIMGKPQGIYIDKDSKKSLKEVL